MYVPSTRSRREQLGREQSMRTDLPRRLGHLWMRRTNRRETAHPGSAPPMRRPAMRQWQWQSSWVLVSEFFHLASQLWSWRQQSDAERRIFEFFSSRNFTISSFKLQASSFKRFDASCLRSMAWKLDHCKLSFDFGKNMRGSCCELEWASGW